ncbi:TetR/AcrR family transcriptional regulator [Actinophytocola oryzae]|uniref:TetR/AcrR family transcriptional regulator n=1 Tax=Actinophytocola oryzae TaxID=502181 RepID=UPI0010627E7A|nr:helix-turn-helix domain-containing protein [Actinophytocola oryzae]
MPGVPGRRAKGRPVPRVSNLDTAERLFVQQGATALSNRRFGSVLDVADGTVSGHHFETKADLVRAITRRFTVGVESTRAGLLAQMDSSAGIRDWLGCLLHPWTDHFAQRSTTYFARVCAQAMADPTLRAVIFEEARQSPTLRATCDALDGYLPPMPEETAAQRGDVVSQVIVQVCAEREAAVAAGTAGTGASWRNMTVGLIDMVAGIWTAPCTAVRLAERSAHRGAGLGERT